MAHEIRNPLGGIKGFASLLTRDLKDDPDKQKLAQYIVEGTDTLDRLVVQVLNYSRPLTPNLKEIPLHDLLKEWEESLKASASHNPLHRIDPTSETIHLPLDGGLFSWRSRILRAMLFRRWKGRNIDRKSPRQRWRAFDYD